MSESQISFLENTDDPKPLTRTLAAKLAPVLQIDLDDLLEQAGWIDAPALRRCAAQHPALAHLLNALPQATDAERTALLDAWAQIQRDHAAQADG